MGREFEDVVLNRERVGRYKGGQGDKKSETPAGKVWTAVPQSRTRERARKKGERGRTHLRLDAILSDWEESDLKYTPVPTSHDPERQICRTSKEYAVLIAQGW